MAPEAGTERLRRAIRKEISDEQLFFVIKGVAEEPLSENHFHLKVNNEDSTLFTIPIANPYHEKVSYRVLSDIE